MELEATTFTLARRKPTIVTTVSNGLTGSAKRDCTSDCTPNTKTSNGTAQDDTVNDDFAEAMALIAKLPLTKAEKLEAVRRLLAGKGASK